MRTNIDIDDKLMADAMKFTKAKTKGEAIITAITDYNHRHRSQQLTRFAGKLSKMMTKSDLRKMREGA